MTGGRANTGARPVRGPGPRARSVAIPLCLALLCPCAPASAPPAHAAAVPGEAAREKERLEEVRRKLGELRSSLSGARDQQSRLRDELRASEVEIGETSRALKTLAGRQREKAAELARLQERRRAADAALAGQRAALEQQIVAAYMMGREGQMKIFFNQQDPARLGRMLTYYDYLHRARAERISDIRAGLEEIDALERSIAEEQAALEGLHAERSRQMEALDASRQSRRQTLASLDAEIKSREQQLATLLQDERTLSELVDRLREAFRDLPVDLPDNVPFATLKGRLPWPVEGKLAARFGASRQVEKLTWRGILIDADEGVEVRSVYNGRVAFADWMRGFGLLIIVDHGGGYMSLYGHNQSLYKDVGEVVRKGETIATVGSSGGRGKPGLYFEIRHNGVPDNPALWCRSASR